MLKSLRHRIRHYRTDVYLLSFPKCGRTWLRLMLGRVFERHYGVVVDDPLRLHDYASKAGAPYVRVTHDWEVKGAVPRRVEQDKRRFRHKKIVLLVRDPRDVVVSNYFHRTRRDRDFTGSLEDFIERGDESLRDLIEYYNVWARNRTLPRDRLWVSYEEMHIDTVTVLDRVCRFCGLGDVDSRILQEVVEQCSFDNMRKLEQDAQLASSRMRPGDANDPNSFKVRSGRIGGYREHLEGELLRRVNEYIVGHLDPLYDDYVMAARSELDYQSSGYSENDVDGSRTTTAR